MVSVDGQKFGANIRRLRRKSHLTQRQLSETLGISLSFLGHIERGTRSPSLETALSLALALNTNLELLLCNCINVHENPSERLDALPNGDGAHLREMLITQDVVLEGWNVPEQE